MKRYHRMDCGHSSKYEFIYMDGCSECLRAYYIKERAFKVDRVKQ